MKIDERIILYVDGQMTEDEKASFERELKSSKELAEDFKKYNLVLSDISKVKNVSTENEYFLQMIPKFRGRFELKRQLKIIPKIAFSVTIIAAVLIFFIFNFNKSNKNLTQTSTSTVNQNISVNNYSDLSTLADQFNFSGMSNEEISNSNSILDSLLIEELDLTPQSLNNMTADNNNSDLNNLVQGINEKEADQIYKEILKKKIY